MPAKIFYFCPDLAIKSAGIRTLYRHVAHLVKRGFQAAILHNDPAFRMPEAQPVPVQYLAGPNTLAAGDIVAIPEGYPGVMQGLQRYPLRRAVIAQNWSYVYRALPDGIDWRRFGIECILTYPDHTGEFLAWAMRLPVHVFEWGIRPDLFVYRPHEKQPQVSYIKRKQHNMEILKRVLYSRNPAFLRSIHWLEMDGLSEEEYARQLRRSTLFLNLSTTEGMYAPYFEAMRSGTLVAGYNAVGAQRQLIGSGERQNCILAENEDYITLAWRLEPLVEDMLRGDTSRWQGILHNAIQTTAGFTMEREEASVASIWNKILAGPATASLPVTLAVPQTVSS
jgi:hypothetical protein